MTHKQAVQNKRTLEYFGIGKSIQSQSSTYVQELVVGATKESASNHLIYSSLQEVVVSNYNGMRELIWVLLAPNLTILRVTFNNYMEEIVRRDKSGEVEAEDHASSSNLFPKLQVLELYGLPKLRSIHWKALSFPCLRQIDVYGCPQLKKLPLNSSSTIGCKVMIKGEESWWNNLDEKMMQLNLLSLLVCRRYDSLHSQITVHRNVTL
ncbi:Disease resistance protein (CC-NBS-LRR class) family [Euphorbia peplus]|nr:Disease resistance protein (CC-NBS-LRR class) family [Euphorbia peplus]